ncbi:DUF29 family protein [Allochromatium palmeri]|uniref:DUF29 family protein n=2 Tax=Allochromatium palmeri TaxID=231048 RepID=A0A6N8EDR6_9GAMM|nr:DUF29 family protein [Allochromatium palmeri]MTW21049.1 DUF29 family protein [Allochromatium palmeri]
MLDLKHLAEEVAEMGKSEQHQLANRLAVLIGHLTPVSILIFSPKRAMRYA